MASKKQIVSVPDHAQRLKAAKIAAKMYNIELPKTSYMRSNRQQPNRRRGKQLLMVNECATRQCILCTETRALERAHIIPVAIYEHTKIEAPLPEIYHHAMWMCPTHHKCYDKGLLSKTEKEHIKWVLGHDYIAAFNILLEGLEAKNVSPRGIERATRITDAAWKWWRHYVYEG